MDFAAQVVVWLNVGGNSLGKYVLAPLAVLPGWLSSTIVAVASGVLLLLVFKYTSNQRAIEKARDDIKAHLLALKLFKDSPSVALRAQGRILYGAALLLVHAIIPMIVMLIPVGLLLGQLGLWYQSRPLKVGEEAVVALKLNGNSELHGDVRLQPTEAMEITLGPVRVISKREICWNIRALQSGYHRLAFQVNDQTVNKELAIGDGLMRVSQQRPGWRWQAVLLHPSEQPLRPDSAIQSIEIEYPKRSSWTSGSDSWMIYWFLASFVSALCFRRLLKVHV
jgi:hypothetical protein